MGVRARHEPSALDRGSRPRRRSSGSSRRPNASPRSPTARSRRCRRCAGGWCSTSSTRPRRARAARSSWRPSASRRTSSTSSASGSSVEKGESLKDTVLTLCAHKPDAIVIRTPWAGAAELVSRWTQRGDRQRRRRQARAPDAGAARRLHAAPPARRARRAIDLDRRRRRPLARRALEHPRLPADGRERDASPARRR